MDTQISLDNQDIRSTEISHVGHVMQNWTTTLCTNSTCTPFNTSDAAVDWTQMSGVILSFTIIDLIISVGILFGHTVVTLTFIKYKFVRTTHNALLVHLSVSDIFSGFCVIGICFIAQFIRDQTFKDIYLVLVWIHLFFYSVQIWGLLLVTVNRWTAIYAPHKHTTIFQLKHLLPLICVIWTLLIIYSVTCAVHTRWEAEKPCEPDFNKLCLDIGSLIVILMPLAVILVLYMMVAGHVWRHRNRRAGQTSDHNTAQQSRARGTKLFRTLTFVLLLLYLSWLPTLFLSLGLIKDTDCFGRVLFAMISSLCLYLGSLLNPLVYHLCSPTFRKAFRKLFHRT